MDRKVFTFGAGRRNHDDQPTCPKLKTELEEEFHFDFDPCPFLNKEGLDGLTSEWGQMNWVNPPYTYTELWIDKGLQELQKGKSSVFLIPARTCNLYWREKIVPNASEIRFITTRLKFGKHKRGLPIPLALVVFRPASKNMKIVKKRNYSFFRAGEENLISNSVQHTH